MFEYDCWILLHSLIFIIKRTQNVDISFFLYIILLFPLWCRIRPPATFCPLWSVALVELTSLVSICLLWTLRRFCTIIFSEIGAALKTVNLSICDSVLSFDTFRLVWYITFYLQFHWKQVYQNFYMKCDPVFETHSNRPQYWEAWCRIIKDKGPNVFRNVWKVGRTEKQYSAYRHIVFSLGLVFQHTHDNDKQNFLPSYHIYYWILKILSSWFDAKYIFQIKI